MPTLVAIQFNADMKLVYDRMAENNKPAKVAIAAIMRRMVVLAHVLLRDGQKWSETTH